MKSKMLYTCINTGLLMLISFCGITAGKKPAKFADKIFVNGKIITVDSANAIAEAVAIKDGKIIAVGNRALVLKTRGAATAVVDLKGKTMIPGIIDGHSHIMSNLYNATVVNLEAPPVGDVRSIPDIIARLKKFKEDNQVKPGEWILARGYDPDQLAEKRHPVKEDLDVDFPDIPVFLTHASGHLAVANSAAFRASGVDSTTQDPEGGQIVRKPGTMEPTGLLLERGKGVIKTKSKWYSLDDELKLLKQVQEYYASFGITTAQDGRSNFHGIKLLNEAANRNQLIMDIEALPDYGIIDSIISNPAFSSFGSNKNHFRLAGFKLGADGSPQGKTAFMSQPYLTSVPGCEEHCTGIPIVNQEQFNQAVEKGFSNNIQVYVHCNGDATVDMYIKAIKQACKTLNTTSIGRRPVIIHSQFMRPEQLDAYYSLGMVPAFFTNHAFFWGDTHYENLGEQRAFFLSPLNSALKKNIVFTNHTDYGVTPINQMFLLWTSVERKSRSGRVIGPRECITPMQGLRAITASGAYQYFQEKTKGSIEPGKLADFAVLSEDPTAIAPEKIKDIIVLETIKEGKTIFKR